MRKKTLEMTAASGLSTDELRELTAMLTRLIEKREEVDDSPASASRLVIEQRRTRTATLQLELVKCGKPRCRVCKMAPAHGPYWYAYWKHEGRTRTKYIGRELPESFTAYHEAPDGDGYIGQTFAIPRSYVTERRGKPKKLHKTTKRSSKPSRKGSRN